MSTAVGEDDDFSILSCWSPKQKVVIVNLSSSLVTDNNKMSSAPTDRLPASLREELRRVVSLKGLDVLFKKSSMKVLEQRQLMHDMFHGNKQKNMMPAIHQPCEGDGVFKDLFEDRTDQVLSRNTFFECCLPAIRAMD